MDISNEKKKLKKKFENDRIEARTRHIDIEIGRRIERLRERERERERLRDRERYGKIKKWRGGDREGKREGEREREREREREKEQEGVR